MAITSTNVCAADFEWGTATWNIDDQQTFNSIDELQLVGIRLTYTNPANFSMTFFNMLAVNYDLFVDDNTEPIKAEASSDPGQGLVVNFDYDFVEGHRYRIVTTEARLVFANIATYSTDTLTTNTDSYTISFKVKGPKLVKTIEVEGTMSLAIVNQETDRTFSALDVNEICQALGIENIAEATVYGLNLNGSYCPVYTSLFDGWRDADGEYTLWYGGWDSYHGHNAYPAVYSIKINETCDSLFYFFYDYWSEYNPDAIGGSSQAPDTHYNNIVWNWDNGDGSITQYDRKYRCDEGSDYKASFAFIANDKMVRVNAIMHFVSQEEYEKYLNHNLFTITYLINGEVYATSNKIADSIIKPIDEPTKIGYTFSWSDIPETMPDHDIVVTGSFTVNSYSLIYKVNGNEYKTFTINYGDSISCEDEPAVKEGYYFSGWSMIPEIMPAHNVIVTGSFIAKSYKLTYLIDGKTYKTMSVDYGTPLTTETPPTKSGYSFTGWSELPETMPAEDVIITGNFIPIIAEGLVLDNKDISLNTEDSYKIEAIITPSDVLNRTVMWSSSNPDVASVNQEGVVTPIDNGKTFIIACTTDGSEVKDSCLVQVDFKASSITLNNSVLKMLELKSMNLNATITPNKANQKVIWCSSDTTIISVDESGNIKTLRNGTANITAATTDGTQLSDTCIVTVDIPRQFEATVTQTTLAVNSINGNDEDNIIVTLEGNEYELNGEVSKISGLAPNTTYHVMASATIGDYYWTEEFDVTTKDVIVTFDCKATPTTLDITFSYDEGDATVSFASFDKEDVINTINLYGLEPNSKYEYTYYITTEEGGQAIYKAEFETEALHLEISQTKVIAIGDVVVVAKSNITDEDNVKVGFEWRRYDWPDAIETRTGSAFIYEGTIEGSIKSLNADKFWNIRPYFLSQAGNKYYGDWVMIDPADPSYFQPSVHTYNNISIENNTAEVKGFVMQGSDNLASQGFMYWKKGSSNTRKSIKAIPSNVTIVEANGNVMTASFTNLDYESEYSYVAFAKTSDGELFYGEELTFMIGTPPDGIEVVNISANSGSETIYDISGRKHVKQQRGFNIIRMSDGTVRKVMVK